MVQYNLVRTALQNYHCCVCGELFNSGWTAGKVVMNAWSFKEVFLLVLYFDLLELILKKECLNFLVLHISLKT